MSGPSLLLVDDDRDLCLALTRFLSAKGYSVRAAHDPEGALRTAGDEPFDAVLLDLFLGATDGMDVLRGIRGLEPDLPVLILTGHADVPTAVNAMKLGAADYLLKPFTNEELALHVDKVLRESRLRREVTRLRAQLGRQSRPSIVVGDGPAIRAALDQLRKVAPTDLTVVLGGESGCGKEVFARLVHDMSQRRKAPFVAVDCGSLPTTLVETELFGYEKGAFTGADSTRLGHFELAAEGTLFLDEIANLSLEVQQKLLRVLQERRIRRLGGRKDIPVDARVVAATNADLPRAVREGRFREDLFHRIDQFTITLPPLRERMEDLIPLARHFLEEANRTLGRSVAGFSAEALRRLAGYHWPGNIRELRNTVLRAALLSDGTIEPPHLNLPGTARETVLAPAPAPQPVLIAAVPPVAAAPERLALKDSVREATAATERRLIVQALERSNRNKSEAARLLGIDRKALYAKLKRYGLE
ncbi:MAG: sigma-54-dependent Fis family transcriptional regulator [Elusimicrobia bacterium]|nr:sigma-54-dependent Fis family transcriptional regulator [Elusimicrobiota bacterium]